MENIRKKFLLGINKETKEIYLGEIEVKNPKFWSKERGYYTDETRQDFTASFDVGKAFNIEDIDENYKDEYKEAYWNGMDAESKINCLDDGEITKKEFFENWDIYDDEYTNYKDCSCTNYETELDNGQTINFETTYAGQHDIREDKENFANITFTNKKAVLMLLQLWDEFHLKNIAGNMEAEEKIKEVIKKLDKYNSREYENIEKFIKNHIEEV